MKLSIWGLLPIILLSCSSEKEKNSVDQFFDEVELGSCGSNTKLFIDARFSECGEWGGHKEKMVIYVKNDNEFYLDYQKFKVDCDKINSNDGTPIQELELTKTLKLDSKESDIISYTKLLKELKLSTTAEL